MCEACRIDNRRWGASEAFWFEKLSIPIYSIKANSPLARDSSKDSSEFISEFSSEYTVLITVRKTILNSHRVLKQQRKSVQRQTDSKLLQSSKKVQQKELFLFGFIFGLRLEVVENSHYSKHAY